MPRHRLRPPAAPKRPHRAGAARAANSGPLLAADWRRTRGAARLLLGALFRGAVCPPAHAGHRADDQGRLSAAPPLAARATHCVQPSRSGRAKKREPTEPEPSEPGRQRIFAWPRLAGSWRWIASEVVALAERECGFLVERAQAAAADGRRRGSSEGSVDGQAGVTVRRCRELCSSFLDSVGSGCVARVRSFGNFTKKRPPAQRPEGRARRNKKARSPLSFFQSGCVRHCRDRGTLDAWDGEHRMRYPGTSTH